MKAIAQDVWGTAPGTVLRLAEVATPTIGDDQVHVRAASVDRGTWHLMAGRPYAMRRRTTSRHRGHRLQRRRATAMPAAQPGARPPLGSATSRASTPERSSSQEMTELQVHLSPARASSRPRPAGAPGGDEVDHPGCDGRIGADQQRAVDSPRGVRDDAVGPAAQLVAQDPEATGPPGPDGPLGDDTPSGAERVGHRRQLDREALPSHRHHQRAVVERAARPPLSRGDQCLEQQTVASYAGPARAERQPQQLHPRLGDVGRRGVQPGLRAGRAPQTMGRPGDLTRSSWSPT